MKLVIIILFCILLVGCELNENPINDKNPNLPEKGEKVEFQTIMQSEIFFNNEDLITIVLQNKQEEINFFLQNPIKQPSYSFPAIDYSKYTVIGILLGFRPSISIKIKIDSIINYDKYIKVFSHEYHPRIQLDAIGHSAHFVIIEKTYLPVVFEEIKVIRGTDLYANTIFNDWYLICIEDTETKEKYFPPREMRIVRIGFLTNYSFLGLAPCNSYSGSFQLHSNNGISITNLQTFLMACQLDTLNYWESLYYNALLNTQKYEISSDTLRLFYNQNKKALVYKRF